MNEPLESESTLASLAGRTILITGASRGIGKAIALRAARDGANVIVIGKTEQPHPKLPGTVPGAVTEIEEAGGAAVGCICDVRDELQIEEAVNRGVQEFGGIDAVVNNASAIFLAGTAETPAKRYDLMQAVNGRGTFFVSQFCLPYLRQSENPHILNIAPPLNLDPKWFSGHLAYTMSKYAMSFCVLGMSAELRDEGIAVNALWPRTAIDTAAIRNLLGGSEAAKRCRHVSIMADAAHWILTQSGCHLTGQFFIDDEVLRRSGVADLSSYADVPDDELLPDFFV